MGNRPVHSEHFEPDHLYLQWLRRRQAWPMRMDRVTMPWLWRLVALCVAAFLGFHFLSLTRNVQGALAVLLAGLASGAVVYLLWIYFRRVSPVLPAWLTGPWLRRFALLFLLVSLFPIAHGSTKEAAIELFVVTTIIGLAALVSTLLDFLLHVPRCVHKDTDSGMMQPIWHAPITTADILRDLRRWAIALNLRHLEPAAALFAGMLANRTLGHPWGWSYALHVLEAMLKETLPIAALLLTLWWFLLGCGLAAAALPRRWTTAGGMLLIWVLPVVFGVLEWGGGVLATLTWHGMFPHATIRAGHEWHGAWLDGNRIVLLLVPSVLTWLSVPFFMEMRRQGRWS